MFALWTWAGTVGGEPPDVPGHRETITIAAPAGNAGQLTATDITCALVDPPGLAALRPPALSMSVTGWQAILAGDTGISLPAAAHAVPNATGTAVTSAAHAQQVATSTAAGANELRPLINADLRPYQLRGIGWLRETIASTGGAVLADEMGLGKTIQAIGYLATASGNGPQLVLCPVSLTGNWVREISRFAPGLRAAGWRGGPLDPGTGQIIVAGYPALRTHAATLAAIPWATAIFDEAQALKNPRTQLSRAARALSAPARIALTGTPVENHLDELWALLNLVAPQHFGHKAQFRRRFVRPINEGSVAAAARLRDAIEPIVLARRKSQVAATLPEKLYNHLSCGLTPEQEAQYDQVLGDALESGFGTGAERQTKVLAALTALKQVCNHPGLRTGDLAELSGRSGKLDLCTSILASNLEAGAPTLVFTQYRLTGELLVRHCAEQFGVRAPFFHGGLSPAERGDIVTAFQADDGPPVLVLSLKAGGTGLTLTRAADVVHYDRWWNPAVEAQASDRVHRIGQTRTVTITTLTCGNTLEEHIASMHGRKSAVADLSDVNGVAALARLDDDRLAEVLRRKREN